MCKQGWCCLIIFILDVLSSLLRPYSQVVSSGLRDGCTKSGAVPASVLSQLHVPSHEGISQWLASVIDELVKQLKAANTQMASKALSSMSS